MVGLRLLAVVGCCGVLWGRWEAVVVAQPSAIAQVMERSPETVTGELTEDLPTFEDGTYYESHNFEGSAGEIITIDLMSEDFDTYLLLRSPSGEVIAENDDGSSENTNSRIVVTLPESGTYTLMANSYEAGAMGAYRLSWRTGTVSEQRLAEAVQLNTEGIGFHSSGQYEEAEPLYRRALEIRESELGANHPDTAESLSNLAELYRVQGRYEEAEPLMLRVLDIWESELGANHPNTALRKRLKSCGQAFRG
jgi:tetratricopeptide (TPR) repeat protein